MPSSMPMANIRIRCMEDERLWQKVFGYEYMNNDAFEEAMLKAYTAKIKQ